MRWHAHQMTFAKRLAAVLGTNTTRIVHSRVCWNQAVGDPNVALQPVY